MIEWDRIEGDAGQGCTRMQVVANKYKVITHCYCIMGGGVTVHKLDCLEEKLFLCLAVLVIVAL